MPDLTLERLRNAEQKLDLNEEETLALLRWAIAQHEAARKHSDLVNAAKTLLAEIDSKERYGDDAFDPNVEPLQDALNALDEPGEPGGESTVTPRDVAAFILDRADQYSIKSPCWVPMSDAAQAIMRGEVDEAKKHGELDEDLYRRVDGWKK